MEEFLENKKFPLDKLRNSLIFMVLASFLLFWRINHWRSENNRVNAVTITYYAVGHCYKFCRQNKRKEAKKRVTFNVHHVDN